MLDNDLAALYEVETFNLNKAVKRNIGRFPSDFMFQLTKEEWENLIFHTCYSNKRNCNCGIVEHNDKTTWSKEE